MRGRRGLVPFKRSVDGGVGANLVVRFLYPFLQREVARVNLRHPALPEHDSPEDIVVHPDQRAVKTEGLAAPEFRQFQLEGFERDLALQLLERRPTEPDAAQVKA